MRVKGVVVAAGYGTRFLPITRAVPKEMLPIVDRPAIDLVVEELVDAGVRDILVVTSRRKRILDDWFDVDKELEAVFTREAAADKLAKIVPPDVRVTFVRQQEMKGTGHAILLAREFAGDDPVVVAYPDDLFGRSAEGGCTAELVAEAARTGASVLSCHDLSGQDVSRYGVLDVAADGRVRRLVEKPAPGTEPSAMVSLGRYLFQPSIFPLLERGLRGWEGPGEYPHVHAINALADRGEVVAKVVSAPRYDTGAPLGYLQTVIEHALAREDLGPDLRAWLERRLEA